MSEKKLEKILTGFENTKQLFVQSTLGRYFARVRNIILAAYFLPLATSTAVALLKPTCVIIRNPFSSSGCNVMGIDTNRVIEFYHTTNIGGLISLILLILIIKALFMIKFINANTTKSSKT